MSRRFLILVLSACIAVGPAFAKGGHGGDGGGGRGGGHDGGGAGGGRGGGSGGDGPGGGGPGGGGPGGGGHDKGGGRGGGGSDGAAGSGAGGADTAGTGTSGSVSGSEADEGSPAGKGGSKGAVGTSGPAGGPVSGSGGTTGPSAGSPRSNSVSSGGTAAPGTRPGLAATRNQGPIASGLATGALSGIPLSRDHGDSRLPRSLVPSGPGAYASLGRVRLTALPFRRGTSIMTVRACRAAIVEASRPFGAVRVDAAGAGPARTRTGGSILAPVEVRIVYARGGRYQVRRADTWCELDTAGRVVAIR